MVRTIHDAEFNFSNQTYMQWTMSTINTRYMLRHFFSAIINSEPSTHTMSYACNPRTAGCMRLASLYFAARGHVCNLCIFYKKQTAIYAVQLYHLLFLHARPVDQPIFTAAALGRKRAGSPWLTTTDPHSLRRWHPKNNSGIQYTD